MVVYDFDYMTWLFCTLYAYEDLYVRTHVSLILFRSLANNLRPFERPFFHFRQKN